MEENKRSNKVNREIYNEEGKRTEHLNRIDRDGKKVCRNLEKETLIEKKIDGCFENLEEEYVQKYMDTYGKEYINEVITKKLGISKYEYLCEKWILLCTNEIAKLEECVIGALDKRIKIEYLTMILDDTLKGINDMMDDEAKKRIKERMLKICNENNNIHYLATKNKVETEINVTDG